MKSSFRYLPVLGVAGLSGSAMAAVPAGVTTALTDALTDVGIVGAAVFLVIIGIATWKYLKRTP